MEIFLSIIFIAFGILQIILFFKVWDMCNDVKKIATKMKAFSYENKQMDKALLKGDKQLVIDLLTEDVVNEYLYIIDYAYDYDYDRRIKNIKDKYEKKFNDLKVDIPKPLKEINTGEDLINWKANKYNF